MAAKEQTLVMIVMPKDSSTVNANDYSLAADMLLSRSSVTSDEADKRSYLEKGMDHKQRCEIFLQSQGKSDTDLVPLVLESYIDAMRKAVDLESFDKASEIIKEALVSPCRNGYTTFQKWKLLENICDVIEIVRDWEHDYSTAEELLSKCSTFVLEIDDKDQQKYFLVARLDFCRAQGLLSERSLAKVPKAIQHLLSAVNLLKTSSKSQASEYLLRQVTEKLAYAYSEVRQYEEAARMYMTCSEITPKLREQLLMKALSALMMSAHNKDDPRAREELQQVFDKLDAEESIRSDWKLQASLLFTSGRIYMEQHQPEKAMKEMEAAMSMCDSNNYDYSKDEEKLIRSLEDLVHLYISHRELESALNIVTRTLLKIDFGSRLWVKWQFLKAEVLSKMGTSKYAEASQCYKEAEKHSKLLNDGGGKAYALCEVCKKRHILISPLERLDRLLAYAWVQAPTRVGSYTVRSSPKIPRLAFKALDEAEAHVNRQLEGRPDMIANIHLNRGMIYGICAGEYDKARDEFKKAEEILKDMRSSHGLSYDSNLEEHVYLNQARLAYYQKDQDLPKMSNYLDKCRKIIKNKSVHLPHFTFLEALLQMELKNTQAAAKLAEDAAKLMLAAREKLRPDGWTNFLDDPCVADVFSVNELLASNAIEGLLWAERSRTRLFMHIVENQQNAEHEFVVPMDMKAFDESLVHGQELLGDAVKACGVHTAIIVYSYWATHFNCIKCYLLYPLADGQIFLYATTSLLNSVSMLELITSCRGNISQGLGKEERAKDDLSRLHTILFPKDIQGLIPESCTTLVFSPQGILSRIPFHALYDREKKQHLIQQKMVCVIPSIRTLHHCFQRQVFYEKRCQDDEQQALLKPFIAGNPEPMGLGLSPLEYTAEEAKDVAKLLACEPILGTNFHKEAVIEGLRSSSVLLLATHCHEGRIVVRGDKLRKSEESLTLWCLVVAHRLAQMKTW